jgi:hypothetical protein
LAKEQAKAMIKMLADSNVKTESRGRQFESDPCNH